jgi:hypothetical protein
MIDGELAPDTGLASEPAATFSNSASMDWLAEADLYYNSMKTRFCSYLNFSPAEIRGYLGGNAVRFLGLAKNQDGSKPRNRQRLAISPLDHPSPGISRTAGKSDSDPPPTW